MEELRTDYWDRYVSLSHFLLAFSVGYVTRNASGFYEFIVFYMSNKTCVAVMYNYLLMWFIVMSILFVRIFLGRLSQMEREQLYEMTRNYIMDAILFIILSKPRFNGNDIPITTLTKSIISLVVLKCFHILVHVREANLFQVDVPNFVTLLRYLTFVYILSMVDSYFITSLFKDLTWKNTFTIWLLFEIVAMMLICVFSTTRILVNSMDYYYDDGLQNKTTVLFYVELCHDVVSLFGFILFMLIFYIHNPNHLPLYMLIDILHVFKNLFERIRMLKQYRKILESIETRYSKPTNEEKERDGTCIICRDEFDDDCRKIDCGHIFHLSCLKSWLFQHSTCPTCRTPIESDHTAHSHEHSTARRILALEIRTRRFIRRTWRRVSTFIANKIFRRRRKDDPESVKEKLINYSAPMMKLILDKTANRRLIYEFFVQKPDESNLKENEAHESGIEPSNVIQENNGIDIQKQVDSPDQSSDVKRQTSESSIDTPIDRDLARGFSQLSADSILQSIACSPVNASTSGNRHADLSFDFTSTTEITKPRRRGSFIKSWFRKRFSRSSLDSNISKNNESPVKETASSVSDRSNRLKRLFSGGLDFKRFGSSKRSDRSDSNSSRTLDQFNPEVYSMEHLDSSSEQQEWEDMPNPVVDTTEEIKSVNVPALHTINNNESHTQSEIDANNVPDEPVTNKEMDDNKEDIVERIELPGIVVRGLTDGQNLNFKMHTSAAKLMRKLRILRNRLEQLHRSYNIVVTTNDNEARGGNESLDDPEDKINKDPLDGVNQSERSNDCMDPKYDQDSKPTDGHSSTGNIDFFDEDYHTESCKRAMAARKEEAKAQELTKKPTETDISLIRRIRIAKFSKDSDTESVAQGPPESENADKPVSYVDEDGMYHCSCGRMFDDNPPPPPPPKNDVTNVEASDTSEPPESNRSTTNPSTTNSNFYVLQGLNLAVEGELRSNVVVRAFDVWSTVNESNTNVRRSTTNRTAAIQVEALNKLIQELQFLEEHNIDILLPTDSSFDEKLASIISEDRMPAYKRDLFLSYLKMLRMWFLCTQGIALRDLSNGSLLDTTRYRLSSSTSERQRNVLQHLLESINCYKISKTDIEGLHNKYTQRSTNYQNYMARLLNVGVPVDLLDSMVSNMSIMDTIFSTEMDKLDK
ncbi:zinc finger C3HC4 type domain containing protein [Babesia bovis T2Bo]|uniref:RING-type E3 ubiquitin transferase n=1 Tax=Babesia bovis TaxID=5865 RepID=A7AS53_BABBO|nr:zinc finger C3HC4 type domain containing protein [Babesia bovis T2Bo]EDO07372.1 zinc finger C3HC4 type domain containing protein [Babesia bovis T2Bo]|eukprot:XP_001610940.1 zinc finger, C3HC4 type domain containing protein [Babesia bovis T2Bo]